jgi:hypothetical protein
MKLLNVKQTESNYEVNLYKVNLKDHKILEVNLTNHKILEVNLTNNN